MGAGRRTAFRIRLVNTSHVSVTREALAAAPLGSGIRTRLFDALGELIYRCLEEESE